MFSFFKKTQVNATASTGSVHWSDTMLYTVITQVMTSLEITGGMYSHRAIPADSTNSSFVIVIKPTEHFAMCAHTSALQLANIEELIKSAALSAYGIVVDGVYWKASAPVMVFEKITNTRAPSTRPFRSIEEIAAEFDSRDPWVGVENQFNIRKLSDQRYAAQ